MTVCAGRLGPHRPADDPHHRPPRHHQDTQVRALNEPPRSFTVPVDIPRFNIIHDSHHTWSLHIRDVQAEDKGYYMCQVNTDPMISQTGHLDVVGE